jgi:uncharacterized phage protein gp47/JayE
MPKIVEADTFVSPIRAIRHEAEQRMARGILVNGVAFRADETSTQRVGELLSSFEDGLVGPEGVTFRTASGVVFTLTGAAHAQAVYDAQRRHRAACLAASAALQAAPPADPTSDAHWPMPESITL